MDPIIKIQRWFKRLPECYKCGSKGRIFASMCQYCYHDKYSDTCHACIYGYKHYPSIRRTELPSGTLSTP